MNKPSGVTINLLDKQYQIACPDEEREDLTLSARYLDQQMRNIKASGKVVGLDRIAIMAALNISHELLKLSHFGSRTWIGGWCALERRGQKRRGSIGQSPAHRRGVPKSAFLRAIRGHAKQ